MLKITLHDSAHELRLRAEGKLAGLWVHELCQCWHTAASTTAGRKTVLDLRDVDFVDHEGECLLAEMCRAGVKLLAATPFIRDIVTRCATVEGKPRDHVPAPPSKHGSDPRPL